MHWGALISRTVLIALLPVIAGGLYLSGQKYDPALIDFKAPVKQDVGSPAASLPDAQDSRPLPVGQDIAGFQKVGQPHRYTKENLYERVDGHAEYFISAGFQGLTVSEYTLAGGEDRRPEVEAEVYDMGKSIQAFGVLSDESGDKPAPAPVGTIGYKTSGGINYIKGKYYVKISALNPKTPLLQFAKAFADTLPGGQESFQIFSKFPDLGKVENTKFVKEGYRGLDFLHNVIEREYSTPGGKVKVALMAGGEQEVLPLMTTFLGYFGKSGMMYEKTEKNGMVVYKVVDKYEGNWFLIRSRDAVFGVFGTDEDDILRFFVKA